MKRTVLILFLALSLALPNVSTADGEIAQEEEGSKIFGSSFFWGALGFLNAALLVSSISDLGFYGSRAEELEDDGLDAGVYRDAAGREKFVVGITAASFVFSMAGLKKSLEKPKPAAFYPGNDRPLIDRMRDEEQQQQESNTEVISDAGPLQYDSLFIDDLHGPPVVESTTGAKLFSFETSTRVDTFFAVKFDTSAMEDMEVAESVDAEDGYPAELDTVPPLEQATELAPVEVEQHDDPLGEVLAALPQSNEIEQPELVAISDDIPAIDPPTPHGDTGAVPIPDFELSTFAVHVSSFRTLEQAEADMVLWESRGEEYITIEVKDLANRGLWFRVLVGNYEEWADAVAASDGIEEKYGIEYTQPVRRAKQ